MKRLYSILIVCIVACAAYAQTNPNYNPDLQTIDDGFFDPNKKPDKVKEPYHFAVEYRIEAGYIQSDQRVPNDTVRYGFLHGPRIGATFTFCLPYHFGIQTGVLYSLGMGNMEQHYRSLDAESVQKEYMRNFTMEHNLTIPIRLYYTIPLWKKLNLFFYTGPQMQVGVAHRCYVDAHLSEGTRNWLNANGVQTEDYDRYDVGELRRFNIQYGLGGGLEWDRYRLQAGYDFGLNNLIKTPRSSSDRMWEWQWGVNFSYRF